ncbi:endonuclease 8-like 1 [Sycon ciliatum]|uniref:endonuclease 8-like 1 n=1 Tax=Sycon ciliatum TaxID=27933 RepID=UPI0031F61904
MPELPEIRLAAGIVNDVCKGRVFTGAVRKSPVSKNPEVLFAAQAYTISAESRGKELALSLCKLGQGVSAHGGHPDKPAVKLERGDASEADSEHDAMRLLFHFGMSGRFQFTTRADVHKHAHLMFTTNEHPPHILSFVDVRRFGTWHVMPDDRIWSPDRSPDPVWEYVPFRENVLRNLANAAFNKPICEALLNQQYFNGIGNYLRCEILFRASIPPFACARDVLTGLPKDQGFTEVKEVLNLRNGAGYDPDGTEEKYSEFLGWLQCYTRAGSSNCRDHNGRTVWYQGPLGKLAPKTLKTVGKARLTKPPARDVKLDPDADGGGESKKSSVRPATAKAKKSVAGKTEKASAPPRPRARAKVTEPADSASGQKATPATARSARIRSKHTDKSLDKAEKTKRTAATNKSGKAPDSSRSKAASTRKRGVASASSPPSPPAVSKTMSSTRRSTSRRAAVAMKSTRVAALTTKASAPATARPTRPRARRQSKT